MSEAAGMEVVTFEADPGGEADQPSQGEEEEADCCAEEANLTEGMLRGFHFLRRSNLRNKKKKCPLEAQALRG